MLWRFFENNKKSGDYFFSLRKRRFFLGGCLALLFCNSVSAILSEKTAAIHGYPPIAEGTLYLLQPDGVTLLEKGELLHPSDIPNQFRLSRVNKGLKFSDEDGDLGLSGKIMVDKARITWMSEDAKPLTEYEKSVPLGIKKYCKVEVVVPIEVSSSTGIPFKNELLLHWFYEASVGIVPQLSEPMVSRREVFANQKDSSVITIKVTDQRNQPIANQEVLISVRGEGKIGGFSSRERMFTNIYGKISLDILSNVIGPSTVFFELPENKQRTQTQIHFINPK